MCVCRHGICHAVRTSRLTAFLTGRCAVCAGSERLHLRLRLFGQCRVASHQHTVAVVVQVHRETRCHRCVVTSACLREDTSTKSRKTQAQHIIRHRHETATYTAVETTKHRNDLPRSAQTRRSARQASGRQQYCSVRPTADPPLT